MEQQNVIWADLAECTGEKRINHYLNKIDFPEISYSKLSESEYRQAVDIVKNEIEKSNLRQCGPDGLEVWEKGWGEILRNLMDDDIAFSLDTLRPQYFKHNYLRFKGEYIKTVNPADEEKLYTVIRQYLFSKYFADIDNAVEFGAGTGTSACLLLDQHPSLNVTACDWAIPSQKIMELISQKTGKNIIGKNFDMFTLAGKDSVPIDNCTAVYTLHAMEQLGHDFKRFVDYLIA